MIPKIISRPANVADLAVTAYRENTQGLGREVCIYDEYPAHGNGPDLLKQVLKPFVRSELLDGLFDVLGAVFVDD
jgi:hypothetical protein